MKFSNKPYFITLTNKFTGQFFKEYLVDGLDKDSVIAIYQAMLPDLPWTHSISDILNHIDIYIKLTTFYEKH